MSSSDSSGQSECGEIPATPATPSPSNHNVVERIASKRGVRQFLVVDHSANERAGARISTIWLYGGERRRLDDKSIDRYWRCNHCKGAIVFKIKSGLGGTTSYILRHLKNKHNVIIKENKAALSNSIARSSIFTLIIHLASSTVADIVIKGYKALILTLDTDRFRKALIMFFVIYNIAFHVVESPYYYKLLLAYSAGVFKPFLIYASNTLKR
jgi:hypothetical protein